MTMTGNAPSRQRAELDPSRHKPSQCGEFDSATGLILMTPSVIDLEKQPCYVAPMSARTPDPISRAIGLVIKKHRGSRTQAAISEEAGIGSSVWSLYESGRRRPSQRSLARIAKVTRLTEEEMLLEAVQLVPQILGRDGQAAGLLPRLTSAQKDHLANLLNQLFEQEKTNLETRHAIVRLVLGLED